MDTNGSGKGKSSRGGAWTASGRPWSGSRGSRRTPGPRGSRAASPDMGHGGCLRRGGGGEGRGGGGAWLCGRRGRLLRVKFPGACYCVLVWVSLCLGLCVCVSVPGSATVSLFVHMSRSDVWVCTNSVCVSVVFRLFVCLC